MMLLSNNLRWVPGADPLPGRAIILPSQVPDACRNWRAHVYYSLICGVDAPDAKKAWFRADSHESDADIRAKNALACSVHRLQAEGVEERVAAEQLGHSIHFLQDLADPTNYQSTYKLEVRTLMAGLLEGVLRIVALERRIPMQLNDRLSRARADSQAFNDADQVIAAAQQVARVFRPRIQNAYAAGDSVA